jgi:hypothetical protein
MLLRVADCHAHYFDYNLKISLHYSIRVEFNLPLFLHKSIGVECCVLHLGMTSMGLDQDSDCG